MPGRADTAARKRGQRRRNEKGITLYLTRGELEAAGIDPDGPPPWYRVVGIGRGRGRFVIQLFKTGP